MMYYNQFKAQLMNILVGLAKEESEENRRKLYLDIERKYDEWEPYSISEYRNNDTALCAERAAIAQNMLAFLGADTYYIMGHLSKNDGFINMNHAYNVIVDKEYGSGMIVDFTNPVLRQSLKERYVFKSNIINKNSIRDFLIGKHKEEKIRPEFYNQGNKEYRKTSYCLYSLNELSKEEITRLKSKQSLIEKVDIIPEGTRKLAQEQLIGKSQAQIEREKKDKEAEQRTRQQIKRFRESTSDKDNQTLSKRAIRNAYTESAIDGNEIQNAQKSLKEEIIERNEMKKLQFLGKNRTPEQEIRFQQLQHIYKINQRQGEQQSKNNGMYR